MADCVPGRTDPWAGDHADLGRDVVVSLEQVADTLVEESGYGTR